MMRRAKLWGADDKDDRVREGGEGEEGGRGVK